jgi:FAD/FMN-containing dehydrogenase
MVLADGSRISANEHHDSDLYWASRGGGGGNFGIATRFAFTTVPVPTQCSYFIATWPWQQADEVLGRFLSWAPGTRNSLGAICRLATGQTAPSVQVFGQLLGPATALTAELAGLVSGMAPSALRVADASWIDLLRRFAGCLGRELSACAAPSPQSFVGGSDYLDKPLSAAGLNVARTAVEARQAEHAGGALLFDVYGGAIRHVGPTETAFVHRKVLASCQEFALGDASARRWVNATRKALHPYVSGSAYQNYIDRDLASWQTAYYGANLRQLTKVKRTYDPKNRFHFAQSIPLHA